jgi:ApbE superfamily uncharacterized protein (UPF0280 family)
MPASRAELPGGRWHFQHGPIDIVIGAEGEPGAVAAAHETAWCRFAGVLEALVAELPLLRRPVDPLAPRCPLRGVVAARMWAACRPFAAGFITPMAAVAGAVAQELVPAYARRGIRRAWVNNGGDIALHLAAGASVSVGVLADLARAAPGRVRPEARFVVAAAQPVRGIATSGWRGRSFSLGIADSVTVLARSAAMADAAATVVANAVDCEDPRIVRRAAASLRDDSDLGERLVTVDVPPLPPGLVAQALQRGSARARALQSCGLIAAAALSCQGRFVIVEPVPADEHAAAAPAGLAEPATEDAR